jgi:undecaprenyl diphosphate synthase
MDGNARWARARGLPVLAGHREGAKTLKQIVKDAVRLGIDELSVYAFSTENWQRPRAEVEGLMEMFAELIDSETPELNEEGVRMRFIGRRDEVSQRLQ